jgi:5-methylcytosine-specific restriction endonuclease McrA
MHGQNLKTVSDDELLRRLAALLKNSRRIEADLVAHIAEVDARKLYRREATPSMFAYCTEVLHLSEPEAALRIRVARAAREHPGVLTRLRDGRIHLSGVALLAPLLTPRNRDRLLKRAAHRSKREIERLVAELAPRPEVAATMRKLPARQDNGPGSGANEPVGQGLSMTLVREQRPDAVGPASPCITTSSGQVRHPHPAEGGTSRLAAPSVLAAPSEGGHPPHSVPARSTRRAAMEPLSEATYKVTFTASAELHDKLERLQAITRSAVPDGDMGKVIELAVTRELERLEARRFGKTNKPRKTLADTDTHPRTRHIPAAVRRAVRKRDGGRCTYRDRSGRRCTRRHDLEFHHRVPFGRGGDHNPKNVALMCKSHNALMAEQDYGKEVMERFTRSTSPVSEVIADPGAPSTPLTTGPPGLRDRPEPAMHARGPTLRL